jgi:hypothetical protein
MVGRIGPDCSVTAVLTTVIACNKSHFLST